MSLPASGSDHVSNAFDRFHPAVQKWVWQQNWQRLHPIQERVAAPILAKQSDIIIAATTSGGKTEAAFFPAITRYLEQGEAGFGILYISPLKALINDQAWRLKSLCDLAEMAMTPWHGDIAASVKSKALADPRGLVLITPESLEAMFVRRGAQVAFLFSGLQYVIIDELHAFIGTERGMQLLSLLSRLERVLKRRVVRIGLSATLGDMDIAARALRVGAKTPPQIISDDGDGPELRVQLLGFGHKEIASGDGSTDLSDGIRDEAWNIERHLLKNLRGQSHLIFASSRRRVEAMADRLRRMCDDIDVPNEFFPHHGSLSTDLRQSLEGRLKEGRLPTTAVTTTTLELGIDIGDVVSVAQIGAPRSICGLRQRLGRSGRRGDAPSILRVYAEEAPLTVDSPFPDRLRQDTVMSVAAIRLLVEKWCESSNAGALHLSTLTHQILALIKQYGGMGARALYRQLCAEGPFRNVGEALFIRLLRRMGHDEVKLVEQDEDGALLLGEIGERIADRYDFYAVFQTPEEYRLEWAGRTLGRLPVRSMLVPGQSVIFAGQRWQIGEIDNQAKVVRVKPASGGVPPSFSSTGSEEISDRLVEEMRLVYQDHAPVVFCHDSARRFLDEGRKNFATARLGEVNMLAEGDTSYLLPWLGTRRQTTLSYWLGMFDGIKAECEGITIRVTAPCVDLLDVLGDMAKGPPPDAMMLADGIRTKGSQKYHQYLDDDLLNEEFARDRLATEGLPQLVARLIDPSKGGEAA